MASTNSFYRLLALATLLFNAACSDESVDDVLPAARHIDGQVIPNQVGSWLRRYPRGQAVFVAGPGDPEDFLYRGQRNVDGTRSGDQDAIIDRLAASGANSLYFEIIRSHRGDGDDTHNPFNENDESLGLNKAVLDQWEGWFRKLDAAGVVVFLFIYDDSATIWDTGEKVGDQEAAFIAGIVNRFKFMKNLVWVVAEEYSEAFSPKRVSEIARKIKEHDEHGHPVGVHKLRGDSFSEFELDPYVDVFLVQARQMGPHTTARHDI